MTVTETDAPTRPPISRPHFLSAAATHVGAVRKLNEDHYLDRGNIGLWLVADGVGGASAGDWGSKQVAAQFAAMPPPRNAPEFLAHAKMGLTAANAALRAHASSTPRGMVASTVVLLLVYDWYYTMLWAGDSRGYLVREGQLQRITKDHSEVQELIDSGVITPEQAENHPRANVITRAVGAADELHFDRIAGRIRVGDMFLLCTDGLTKEVSEPRILDIISNHPLDQAPHKLVEAALASGGHDNITVVLAQCTKAADVLLPELNGMNGDKSDG
ncbi:MAG: serine/threonine-protein phosphatase [Alphaproteobacteria bacterium]|nr:serine/threonine-protein phosphatase [Alphaproteobacteria bacterium]